MKATSSPQTFLPYGKHFLDEDDIQSVVQVLRERPITQGPTVAEFEEAIARFVGSRYAVAVSSGTAALHLAVLAAGVQPGDTVVTSANTFAASANCAWYAGARPAFCDIDPKTLNIEAATLEKACHGLSRIKAIIPVHFSGLPCHVESIRTIADKHNAVVIEDAAHALGSTYPDGSRVGNCRHSAMTIFSFHPVKLIATGEGGMITTNDESLYRSLLKLRTHGITKDPKELLNADEAFTDGIVNPWYHEMQDLGFNYRITDIQAALGISQLTKIDAFLNQRQKVAERYDMAFSDLRDVVIPQRAGRSQSAQHLYVLRIPFGRGMVSRARFMKSLQEAGIGSQVHYLPVYWHPFYQKNGFKRGLCPEAERYYSEAISLPMYFTLSELDQKRVIETVKELIA